MQRALYNVVEYVTLDGYGRSPGFVGFFERTGKLNQSVAKKAVNFFVSYFKEKLPEMVIVSSLRFNVDDIPALYGERKEPTQRQRDHIALVESLVRVGLIESFSFREVFGLGHVEFIDGVDQRYLDQYDDALKQLKIQFSVFPIGDKLGKDLEKLLIAPMLLAGLYGHCFIVSEELSLIFYPHDDTGFGIIASNKHPDLNLAKDFLKKAGSLTNFHSIIEK